MKCIVAGMLGVALAYLLGAFVAWDFNAANWPHEGRALASVFSVIFFVWGWAIATDN